MKRVLRIAIADDEPDMQEYFRRMLPRMGHSIVAVASNGRELVEKCRTALPDLVITDIRMPELDGIEAATQICKEKPVPIILVSAHHDAASIERAEGEHILAYLVKPIKQADLESAIDLALLRFAQFRALRQEAQDLRQALDDRKVVERAKGIVMKRLRVDEEEAFRRLRKLASNHNRKVIDVARTVTASEETFATLEQG